jgi:hypothetical protein
MIRKQPLDLRRLRSRPPRGFGWLDHRLLRQGYLARCSPLALALYCLLVCAGDDHGLSFYRDQSICELLGLEPALLRQVRRELVGIGLIAYQRPLYQVLALGEEAPKLPLRPAPSTHRLLSARPAEASSLSGIEGGAAAPPPAGLDLRAMVRAALGKGGQP